MEPEATKPNIDDSAAAESQHALQGLIDAMYRDEAIVELDGAGTILDASGDLVFA